MAERGVAARLAALHRVQRDRRSRWLAVALGAAVGLVLATQHWLGVVAGGALVALWWPRLRQGLLAGLAFGLLVVAGFFLRLALAGQVDRALEMGALLYLSVAMPPALGLLGSLARGVVPEPDPGPGADADAGPDPAGTAGDATRDDAA